jgi:hypothetical protein
MSLLAILTSCAAPPHEARTAASGHNTAMQRTARPPAAPWVASPSAALPQGFPEPGPVGQIMLKDYPAYRAAVATATAGRTDDSLFFLLFDHIKRHDIPMSAPVEMRYAQSQSDAPSPSQPVSMAFIYPNPHTSRPGSDRAVQVVDVPAMKVVSIAVRGSYTASRFWKAVDQLNGWLAAHQTEYHAFGRPRYLAYNSPFVLPFLRSGEVQIPVLAADR